MQTKTIYIKETKSNGKMEILESEREVAIYSDPEIFQIYRVTGMEEITISIEIKTKN